FFYFFSFKPTLNLFSFSSQILVIKVFSGLTFTCHLAEYQIGNECCPMCLPGSRVRTDCTEFRSTSCRPCLEGTYMNKATGLKQCFPCTNCDEGSGLKIKRLCKTTSDTVCEPLEGFYCVDPSDNGCGAAQKHRSCEPGQYIIQHAPGTSLTYCRQCKPSSCSGHTRTEWPLTKGPESRSTSHRMPQETRSNAFSKSKKHM
uniref:TNFR-Cys domain-containing protein n=1 Tax=Anabas testudineus TaxID=64144 RepID=A0A7N5ZRU3_ANATE